MKLVFFGSFQHYSALILKALTESPALDVVGVVTTPPMPVGRKQSITKTPVHLLAETQHLPVFTPLLLKDNLTELNLPDADYFVTAGYGKILPPSWLEYPLHGSLNLHFSLLPSFRGANPAEWVILTGEVSTGISLIRMNEGLDTGDLLQQAALPVESFDTRLTLYQKLYELGARELPRWLSNLEDRQGQLNPTPQPTASPTPYAALLKRQDGFVPWTTIQAALNHQPFAITDFPSQHLQTALEYFLKKGDHQNFQRAAGPRRDGRESSTAKLMRTFLTNLPRALADYPSLWTLVPTIKGDKRLKILSFETDTDAPALRLGQVHLEGQSPSTFNQIKNQLHYS